MKTLSATAKLALLREVYDVVAAGVDSFEHDDMVGPDLAYLLGAILKETYCEWSPDRRIIQLLRHALASEHPVWTFCVVEDCEEITS